MDETYTVTAINGKAPGPAVGRGNRYEVSMLPTGISFSLGCGTVAVAGTVENGMFRASDPQSGGVVTGGGACGIPAAQQWEPQLHRKLLAGEVRVARQEDRLTLSAPDLVVQGRKR
ncbi:MAG: hypothetical protein ACK40O_10215 [Allosphingosinicella sp.]